MGILFQVLGIVVLVILVSLGVYTAVKHFTKNGEEKE